MSSLRFVLFGCLMLGATAGPVTGQEQPVLPSLPDDPDTSATYVFYLHGQIIERGDRRPTHPQFGVYEYDDVLRALGGSGRIVISEQRAAGTDVSEYADHIATQVRTLLARDVPAEQITVVGFSKGGRIAIATSSLLDEPINYVFLAACNRSVFDDESYRVSGRVLSIYEESDEIGVSCAPLLERSPSVTTSKEVRISTGARHGAFYQPRSEWMSEVLTWVADSRRPQ
jgi:hypothetical protein